MAGTPRPHVGGRTTAGPVPGPGTRRDRREARHAAAAARAAAERRRRGRRHAAYLVGSIAAVLVVIGAIVVFRVSPGPSSGQTASSQIIPSTPTGAVTVQRPPQQVLDQSGIAGVLAWDTGDWPGAGTAETPGALEHQHVPGPVTYSVVPPVGGPHNPVWMNAGVYTEPIPAERAVHNLEHGAVWITYRPDLPASQVAGLTDFVHRQSLLDEDTSTGITGQRSRFIDMSPWPGSDLPAPIVLSSWGHQLRVDSPSDPRLQQFVDLFRHSSRYSPEYGEAVDGVPVRTGGRPATDGATKPNPPGVARTDAGMPGG
jgi:hypothetical protein